jgi:hypothetical protein
LFVVINGFKYIAWEYTWFYLSDSTFLRVGNRYFWCILDKWFMAVSKKKSKGKTRLWICIMHPFLVIGGINSSLREKNGLIYSDFTCLLCIFVSPTILSTATALVFVRKFMFQSSTVTCFGLNLNFQKEICYISSNRWKNCFHCIL